MANPYRCTYEKDDGRPCGLLSPKGKDRCAKHAMSAEPRVSEEKAMEETPSPKRVDPETAALDAELKRQGLSREGLAAKNPTTMTSSGAGTTDAFGPEGEALRAALPLLAKEQEARLRRIADRLAKKNRGVKLPPAETYLFMPELDDPAAVPSHLKRPGMIYHWASTKNTAGAESDVNIRRWKGVGGQVVRDSENNNEPVKDILGVLMEIPAANWAANAIRNSPDGAFSANPMMREMQEAVNAVNRAGGKELVSFVVGEGHGTTVATATADRE